MSFSLAFNKPISLNFAVLLSLILACLGPRTVCSRLVTASWKDPRTIQWKDNIPPMDYPSEQPPGNPRPRNLRIAFIGDSLTRYMYLSLVYFLRWGRWESNEDSPTMVQEKQFVSWFDFYSYTKLKLGGKTFLTKTMKIDITGTHC